MKKDGEYAILNQKNRTEATTMEECKDFHPITPSELSSTFPMIGEDFMLISAHGKDEAGREVTNGMTASWGGMGILWGKPVAFCFIRPQRYTRELVDSAARLSLAFFGGAYKDALRLCGTKSGRETDKLAAAGLHTEILCGVPLIREATCNLVCRVLYRGRLNEAGFLDTSLLSNYREKDYHLVYVCEIEQILKKD